MTSGWFLDAVLILLFVLAGGYFSATEMALVSLRDGQVRRHAEQGPWRRRSSRGPGPRRSATVGLAVPSAGAVVRCPAEPRTVHRADPDGNRFEATHRRRADDRGDRKAEVGAGVDPAHIDVTVVENNLQIGRWTRDLLLCPRRGTGNRIRS